MRIAILGAGAVGCYYGAVLAGGGHEVTLIGRPLHVEAIVRNGLLFDTRDTQRRVALAATTDPGVVHDAEVVLVCVKSSDTEAAAAQIAPYLRPGTALLSLQNGVDNAARLAATLDRPATATVVYVACAMAGPGHVRHHGRGELLLGAAPDSAALAAAFSAAGVPSEVTDNVMGALWAKLVLNCAYNPLSAITRQPYARLWAAPAMQATMRAVMDECLAVAAADDVSVPPGMWEAVERIALSMPTQVSSTAQDLARGKATEIDHINGYVLRRGAAHGIATPVNHTLHALVRQLENAQPA